MSAALRTTAPLPRAPTHRGPQSIANTVARASFFTWLQQAVPGDQIIYHTGFLAIDRAKDPKLDADASVLLLLREQGVVALRQVKIGESVWEYWATVRTVARRVA